MQLKLTAKLCSDDMPPAARKILRSAIINVLKTGGVDALELSNGNAPPQDISSLKVPWTGWIATWETGATAPDNVAWDRIHVID